MHVQIMTEYMDKLFWLIRFQMGEHNINGHAAQKSDHSGSQAKGHAI